jgi:diguanylate cyclase (GGDEF)-like protein
MRWSIEQRIRLGFAIALVSLGIIGGLAYWRIVQLTQLARWVNHTHVVIETLESLLANFASAEAGQRGYIITGNEEHLEPYYLALASINDKLTDVQQLTVDNSSQQQRLKILQPAIEQRLALLREVLVVRQKKGLEAAQALIKQDAGRKLTDEIRHIIGVMLDEEHRLLILRSERSQLVTRNTSIVVGIGGVLAFALVPFAGFSITQDITRRREIEAKLQASEQQLKQWIGELEQRSDEISQLAELSDVLQACFTLDEAYQVLAELVQVLFPETTGGIYTISESKTLVEAVATWGAQRASTDVFVPTECWALRRGRSYYLENAESCLHCYHLQPQSAVPTLCVPMMAQGDALGILHLMATKPGQLTFAKQQLALTVTEHIAIALANLKLRETLKNQSIRDPLTGLFNRRYMEESLEREMRRAERNGQSLGIIMLDVDHFKRFNDTFGHEAGDVVLRELGQLIKSMIRVSDIGCRYGGEEFMILLPEVSLEIAQERAEQLRSGMKRLTIENRRQTLGTVTLSLGVAAFPQHGNAMEAVIRAADAALYQAKHQGRDQVVVAE